MADEKLNPALQQDGDDTVTRKTIKLRPASIVTAPAMQPASPRLASNTDTGNIDIADDTQTRRTIKLKPIAPVITAKPTAPVSSPAAAAPTDGDDTVTRKTIKLRPVAPGAAAAAPASEDQNEKTIRIRVGNADRRQARDAAADAEDPHAAETDFGGGETGPGRKTGSDDSADDGNGFRLRRGPRRSEQGVPDPHRAFADLHDLRHSAGDGAFSRPDPGAEDRRKNILHAARPQGQVNDADSGA